MGLGRILALTALVVSTSASAGGAQELIVPFIGTTFKGQTTLPLFGFPTVDPSALSRRTTIGIAGLWLTPGLLGAEAELTHTPRFFQREGQPAVKGSSVTTLTGSLVLAAPLGLTRESLRPYGVGGLGLLRVGVADLIDIVTVDRNLLAVTIGGGAIGMLSKSAGVRFDLRHTRSVRDDAVPSGAFLSSTARVRLSYWRASVGVAIQY